MQTPFRSLRTRMLFFILVSFLPVLGLMYHTARQEHRQEMERIKEQTESLVHLAIGEQKRFFDETLLLLRTLTYLPAVRALDVEACSSILAVLQKDSPLYANMGVVAPDGTLLSSALPFSEGLSFADREWFKRVRDTGAPTISEHVIGRITGTPILVFSSPVFDDQGTLESVLFISLDLGWLDEFSSRARLPEGATVTLIDRGGTTLVRHPDPEKWVGRTLPDAPLFKAMKEGEEGFSEITGLDGVPRLYAFAPLSKAPEGNVYISIGVPSATAFASAQDVLWNLGWMAVVLLMALSAAWVSGSTLLLHPLMRLLRAAEEIKAGNLTYRTSAPRLSGELGQLARAFDRMAESLQQRELERAKIENELRESEEHFRLTFDRAPIGAAIVGMDLRFHRVNEAICTMFGYSKEELCSLRIQDITHPGDLKVTNKSAARLISGEIDQYNIEKRYIRKDGRTIWVRTSVGSVRDADGKTVFFLPMMEDITGRRRAEMALSLDMVRFEALYELSRMREASVRDIVEFALEQQNRITRSRIGSIGFLSEDELVSSVHSWSKGVMEHCAIVESPMHLPVESGGIWAQAVRERRAIITNDYSSPSPHKRGCPEGHAPLSRVLSVPIFDGDRIVMVAVVGNKEEEYDEEDIRQVTLLLGGVWRLLERRRMQGSLQNTNRMLGLLSECNQALVRAGNESELLRRITELIVVEGGYRLAWVGFAHEDQEKSVRPVAHAGYEDGYLDTLRITWANTERGHGPTGTAIREGRPVVVRNIQMDPDFEEWRANALMRGYASSCALPLIIDQKAIGALNIYAARPDGFDDEEMKLLDELANDLAYGISSIRSRARRDQAEEALRHKEEQVRLIIDSLPALICYVDSDQLYQFNNKAYEELFGRACSEIRGRHVREVLGETTYGERSEHIRRALSGEKVSFESEVHYPDAGKRYIQAVYVPHVDEQGAVRGFVSLASDVTERRRMEEDIKESEERYRRLVELSPDLIAIHGDGRFVYVNPAGAGLLGAASPEDLVGKPILDIVHPDYRETVRERARRNQEHGETTPWMEQKVVLPDGRVLHVEAAGAPISYRGKAAAEVFIRDITERKRSEEMLKERERYFRSLLFSMHEDILVIDRRHRITDTNKDFLTTIGLPSKELTGRFCRDVSHGYEEPSSGLLPQRMLKEVFETGRPCGGRHEHTRPDGSKVWIDLLFSPLRDGADGEVTHVIGSLRDMTDEVKLEGQFRQAHKMEAIGTLAGGIAHDFNNILGIIMGYSEMTIFGLAEGSQERINLGYAYKACHRAKDLVQQILTFSRMGEQERKPMQMGPIVKEALKLLRAALPSTIEIRKSIDTGSPGGDVVLADATQIHQVIMNLCTNAGHAMSEKGGILEVGLSCVEPGQTDVMGDLGLQCGHYLQLTVSDTGHGMDKATLDRIFEPYFTTKPLGEGTGLGLAVVHGIVQSHGGAVTVHSEPGVGTSFHVFFPSIQQETVEDAAAASSFPRGDETILFVDDEERLLDVGAQMLRRLGYKVAAMSTGVEVLEVFRADPDAFHLVMTDQTMPMMTGLELAHEILSIRPETPIILCSGFAEAVTSERARNLGIREFLAKPLVLSELANTVRRILDEKAMGG